MRGAGGEGVLRKVCSVGHGPLTQPSASALLNRKEGVDFKEDEQ